MRYVFDVTTLVVAGVVGAVLLAFGIPGVLKTGRPLGYAVQSWLVTICGALALAYALVGTIRFRRAGRPPRP